MPSNKFRIGTLIAAFSYDEVSISESMENSVDVMVVPSRFMNDLGCHLAKMAGWTELDNKVAFLFTNEWNTEVFLITFKDLRTSLISFSSSKWKEIPMNVSKGRALVQTAYDQFREQNEIS